MRVLVTGATAPLGQLLVRRLAQASDVDVVLATGRTSTSGLPPGVRFESVDLTHARSVHGLLWRATRDHGVDTVVHLAQHRNPGDIGAQVHAQNVVAARELVLRCAEQPTIRRFVYRSFAEVYALDGTASNLLDEDAAIRFAPFTPAWLRDRIEADLTICARLDGPLQIAVLRCAEILAPNSGSQLWDYLSSRLCVRPVGFDPMINVLSLEDAVAAVVAAARSTATGVFNIPGADTLPLSKAIAESSRASVPLPGPLLASLYALRRAATGSQFRYDLNRERFHFGTTLDGTRARQRLGYVPRHPVRWPRPWWWTTLEQLAAPSADHESSARG